VPDARRRSHETPKATNSQSGISGVDDGVHKPVSTRPLARFALLKGMFLDVGWKPRFYQVGAESVGMRPSGSHLPIGSPAA
jgi:hypothetical protein